jgi:hypothetical protein
MKKTFGKYAAAFVLLFISFSSFSQDNDTQDKNIKTPSWVSDNGYWTMENNIHQPLKSTIYFYNNQDVLIGEKEISGKKMNVKRKRIKMQLKAMLETSLVAWNNQHPNATDLAKKP